MKRRKCAGKDFDSKVKADVRNVSTRRLEDDFVSKCIMGLWGEQGLDLNLLKSNGSIDPKNTFCIGIENGGEKYQWDDDKSGEENKRKMKGNKRKRQRVKVNAKNTMKKVYRGYASNCVLYEDDLSELNLEGYLLKGRKIDRFIFDMCGNMTQGNMEALYENRQFFADKFHIPITVKIVNRYNSLINRIYCHMNGVGKKIREDLKQAYKGFDGGIGYEHLGKMEEHIFPQLVALQLAFPEWDMIISMGCYHYKNIDQTSQASEMVMVDIFMVKSKKRAEIKTRKIRYNAILGEMAKSKAKKTKRKKVFKNPYEIGRSLGLLDENNRALYKWWNEIVPAKRAWVRQHADNSPDLDAEEVIEKLQGKIPEKVV